MTTTNSNSKWLYVIKPNTSKEAKTDFVASLVLMTKEGIEYYKDSIGKKPMASIYKKFIKFTDGKNIPQKNYCLEIDGDPDFINDIKEYTKWNDNQLND